MKVSFNLRGRKWEKDGQVSYFTNLEAWRVENVQAESGGIPTDSISGASDVPDQSAPFPNQAPSSDDSENDDLPF